MRDFRRLQNDPPSGISGAPLDSDIMKWQAVIFGPDDTPWEGGTFNLMLEFGEDYPNKPPTVRFVTKMFHPNIYNDGQICLDILQNQWSPIYDISAILTSIQSLLCDPNPKDPLVSSIADVYITNRQAHDAVSIFHLPSTHHNLDCQGMDKQICQLRWLRLPRASESPFKGRPLYQC